MTEKLSENTAVLFLFFLSIVMIIAIQVLGLSKKRSLYDSKGYPDDGL